MPDDLLSLLRYVLSSLWRQRWSILVVTWLVAIVGWTVVATLPDRYTASAQVYVDTDSILGPLMNSLAVAPDVQGQVQMMRQTLLSRPNLEAVADKTGLLRGGSDPREVERILGRLQKEIEVRPVDASLLQVHYTAADPSTAHAVVSAVLELFVTENQSHTRRDVDAARSFIDRQIAEYESKLREADLALARFKREHADELLGADRSQRELDDARSVKRSLESELASAEWQRGQLALQRSSTPSRLPRSDVEQGPTTAESELAKLQSDLNRLRLVFTDLHPDVISLTRLIEQSRSEVELERRQRTGASTVPNPLLAQLDEQMRGLELRIADLKRRVGLATEDVVGLTRKAAETPAVEADLLRLTRDYDTLSKNYQELVQRRETANLAKQMDAQTRSVEFRVVEPPVVPARPSGPWRGLFIGAVAVGALGAGVGLGLLRLWLRRVVDRPEQLLAAFEIPIAGVVREIRERRSRVGRTVEVALACLVAMAFVGGTGGLLHRNSVEPLKIDVPEVVDVVGKWVETRLGAGPLG